jgi:alkylation response protein AidB-like acyl-CoA dehydrogenase
MCFPLTEEQKMLQAKVRELAINKLAPVAAEIDEIEEFPMNNFKAMAELGLTGLMIPPEYGGNGGGTVSLVIAMEEIARVCPSTAAILDVQVCLCARPIYLYGNEEQRKKHLPGLAKGEKIGAFAVTEPGAGSDVASIQTTAVKDADWYILNGSKAFISNGNVCDVMVVFATIKELGRRGITAFILEKDTPGFSISKKYRKVGMKAATNVELAFQDARIPAANLLGEEGQGMRICLATLDEGRIGIAAQGVGIAQAVLDHAISYAKQRVQFGRPIAENQAIQWMLADMAVHTDAARLLTYRAAYLNDQGVRISKEAAMAKLYASEVCLEAAIKGIQICGGYGYMMDSPMQRFFRDAKLTQIYEGTSEIQRIVISRALLA